MWEKVSLDWYDKCTGGSDWAATPSPLDKERSKIRTGVISIPVLAGRALP